MSAPSFEGIAGHEAEIARLRTMLTENRLPHGLLFHGQPGIGKAAIATGLAQTLFCSQPARDDGGPRGCGLCAQCRKVLGNNHPDLLRVEMGLEKTRILVDQIRDLNRFFALSPLEGNWKISILDDAGQMNANAANALLKTLEEPPDKSLLILITCRADSLLPTLRSRCQTLRFAPLSQKILTTLAMARGLEPTGARELAAMAEGSASRLLQLCDGDFPALRQKLYQTLAALPGMDLAQVVACAAEWSNKERYPVTVPLLRGWFQLAIHGKLPPIAGETPTPQQILETATRVNALFNRAHLFNLNRQLLLEEILIRHCRLYQKHNPVPPGR